MYVKRFGNFIYNQEITFTNNFNITFKNGILKVEKVKSPISKVYRENIKNITVLNGKNGTGKSTILDIIGMNREDRMAQIYYDIENKVFNEYFLLYFLGEYKDGEDIYGIEFCGNNIFEYIKNCKIEDDGYIKSNKSIGIQLIYDGKSFKNSKTFYSEELLSGEGKNIPVSEQICIFKCDTKRKYSRRINYGYFAKKEEDKKLLSKRIYLGKANNSLKYETIFNIRNNNKIEFFNKEIILEIKDRIDKEISYYIEYDLEEHKIEFKEKLNNAKKDIKKDLGIEEESWDKAPFEKLDNKKELTRKEIKESYIEKLISRYIVYESICELGGYIDGFAGNKKKNKVYETKFLNKIDKIKDLKNTMILGKPVNFEIEVQGIKKIINKYYKDKDSFKDKYEGLMKISRYVSSRIEAGYKFKEKNAYQKAFEDIIKNISKLSEEYFTKEGIYIHIKDKTNLDNNIVELLNLFKECQLKNDEHHNSVNNVFEINFNNLSDGEKELIDFICNIFYANKHSENAKLVILLFDEPDCFLHPEWSRKFLSIIIDYINTFEKNFQLILTTHSPYLISDMFPQNVFRFNRDENNDLKIERLSNSSNSCFGANIYDLLNNSFFMKNSIGEFATNYIKDIIKDIYKLEQLYKEDKNKYNSIVEKIEFCINNIGDPVLKDNISKMYYLKQREIKLSSIKDINNWDVTYNEILDNISNEEEKEKVKKLMDKFRGEK